MGLLGQSGQLTGKLGLIGGLIEGESWWRRWRWWRWWRALVAGGGGGGRSCWQGGNGGKLTVTVATLTIGGNGRARLQVQAFCNLASRCFMWNIHYEVVAFLFLFTLVRSVQ